MPPEGTAGTVRSKPEEPEPHRGKNARPKAIAPGLRANVRCPLANARTRKNGLKIEIPSSVVARTLSETTARRFRLEFGLRIIFACRRFAVVCNDNLSGGKHV